MSQTVEDALVVRELVIGTKNAAVTNAQAGALFISGSKLWVQVDTTAHPQLVTSA